MPTTIWLNLSSCVHHFHCYGLLRWFMVPCLDFSLLRWLMIQLFCCDDWLNYFARNFSLQSYSFCDQMIVNLFSFHRYFTLVDELFTYYRILECLQQSDHNLSLCITFIVMIAAMITGCLSWFSLLMTDDSIILLRWFDWINLPGIFRSVHNPSVIKRLLTCWAFTGTFYWLMNF